MYKKKKVYNGTLMLTHSRVASNEWWKEAALRKTGFRCLHP